MLQWRKCSRQPSGEPSGTPSGQPSSRPSGQPSRVPTLQPTGQPSAQPSAQPSGDEPSAQPSAQPSGTEEVQQASSAIGPARVFSGADDFTEADLLDCLQDAGYWDALRLPLLLKIKLSEALLRKTELETQG